ncbi:pentatricopeptide repeat-containing protein At3g63370, chloroplastic [Curcuma longa]|uniref:pentatricopeptide repeat-containing protein At3g63370, chloroplastic n=1 Tax=Curcuma longa TaxID=136217 RepID=UPI003D9EB965
MNLILHHASPSTSPSPSKKLNHWIPFMALSFHRHHRHHRHHDRRHHSSSNSIDQACKQGNLKQAFRSLPLQWPPKQHAYSSILDLCASEKAPFQGQQLHSHILKSTALHRHGFLGTKLVFMYGKCGRLLDAEKMFDEMPHRSIFAWNALIGAYASANRPSSAIRSYRDMRAEGLLADACTLASVLKACGGLEDVCVGTEVHGLAIKTGLHLTGFVSNALIAMYAKCGRVDSARLLFDRMQSAETDVVSWNSMISACLQDQQFFEALNLFREMQNFSVSMNSYTVVGVLQACAELSHPKLGMEIHASLLKNTRKLEIYESNSLVVLYAKCGRIRNAIQVFEEMDEKDNVSWNSILSGYVQNGLYQESIEFFSDIIQSGFEPDQVSVITCASASGRLGNLLNAKQIHAYAIRHGFSVDMQVGNTLMDMYTKCQFVDYAENVFHKLDRKDCISWTTMIACYAQSSCYDKALKLCRDAQRAGTKVDSMMIGSILQACSGLLCLFLLKQVHAYAIRHRLLDRVLENTLIDVYGECGEVDLAHHIFRMIQDKDVVTWTSMITCYVNSGLLDKALCLFKDMVASDVEPDAVSLISVLAAVAGLSSFMKGKEIHGFTYRRQFETTGTIGSSLVDMYARCGAIEKSTIVFNSVRRKDLILWTTMINATGLHGQGEEAIGFFRGLNEIGIVPDHVTFLALLYACSHSGLINEGRYYIEKMISEYELEPWPEHYACVVDLLGRSGRTEEAYEFIRSMPKEPTAAIWCALLGACRVHQNHELGRIAAEKLLELEPENPGNYVLISNVFAAMGNWKDANLVRGRMKARGLKKDPACSWIEVGSKVHTFIARDIAHQDSVSIYSKLAEITEKLKKEAGYREDTRFVLHNVMEDEKVKMLQGHSERLAIAFGMMHVPKGTLIRVNKNLRVCGDCHEFTKLITKVYGREIIVRDANRFHHFKDGSCSCRNFW